MRVRSLTQPMHTGAFTPARMGTSTTLPGRTAAIALVISLTRRRIAGQLDESRTTTPMRPALQVLLVAQALVGRDQHVVHFLFR